MEIKFIGFHIENSRTQDVTRHQVGCKLYTAEVGIYQTGCQAGK